MSSKIVDSRLQRIAEGYYQTSSKGRIKANVPLPKSQGAIHPMGKSLPTLAVLIILFLAFPSSSGAISVIFEWDPNTETDLEGYKVYYKIGSGGPPYDGTGAVEGPSPVDVKNVTTFTLTGLSKVESYFFVVTAYNTGGLESVYSNEVSVGASSNNAAPVANAGPYQKVAEGTVVQLSGSNSTDPDGISDIASYQWEQISGPLVTLSDPTAVQPTFATPNVGPEGVSLVFQLTVTDIGGLTSKNSCIVNVVWVNQPPIARAGCPSTVPEGILVQLDASGSSDPDDGISSYQWVQKNGPQVTLSDPGAIDPTFTAFDVGPEGAAVTFELTVVDNYGLLASDQCTVNVTWVNVPPIANVGPDQSVNEDATVTLDGSRSSDPDDGIVTYQWTQISGPPITLSDPRVPRSTFVAPDVKYAGAVLIFELTVIDKGGLKSSARCTVNVLWVNTLRIVDAGPANFWVGLKNSGDQGTRFDLRTELYMNDTLISEGETLCITDVTLNPSYAKEVTTPLSTISEGSYNPDDTLTLRVLTRIGTNPDGTKCQGNISATGLRLYYDSPTRPSKFDAEISGDPMTDLFLHLSSGIYFLDEVPPSGTTKYKDSRRIHYYYGNPWKEIGIWDMPLP